MYKYNYETKKSYNEKTTVVDLCDLCLAEIRLPLKVLLYRKRGYKIICRKCLTKINHGHEPTRKTFRRLCREKKLWVGSLNSYYKIIKRELKSIEH